MPKKTTSSKKTQSISEIPSEKQQTKWSDFLKFGESYTSLLLGIIVVIVATVLLLSVVKMKGINKGNNNSQIATQLTQEQVDNVDLTITLSPSALLTAAKSTVTLPASPTPTPKVIQKKTTKPAATSVSEKKQLAQKQQVQKKAGKQTAKVYIVTHGDSLWKIAELEYKSGYNWVDIARANNLSNPGQIYSGNKLIIPNISPKLATITSTLSSEQANSQIIANGKTTIQSSTNMNKITGSLYTVQRGDNLWTIAVRAYGDGYQWPKIAQANNLTNPGLIFSGNVLKIPRG